MKMPARFENDDTGSVSIFVVVVVLALIIGIGLVVDGGEKLRADDRAEHAAEQAARAATQQINAAHAQAGDRPSVNATAAVSAATLTLNAAGVSGSVAVDGDAVTVTTTTTYRTKFLQLIGVDQMTGSGSAQARIARGITEEED